MSLTARQSRTAAAGRPEIRGSGLSGVSRGVYNAAKFSAGLDIDAPNSVVKGLVINRFGGFGVRVLDGGGGSTVEGNFIGTNPSETLDRGNHIGGVSLFFESANLSVGAKLPQPVTSSLATGTDDNRHGD